MTWLGSWLGKIVGVWLGPSEPAAPGAISARLTGNSNLSGSLQVTGVEQVVDDLAATIEGSSSFLATAQPVQTPAGGGMLTRIRRLWKHKPVYINLAASQQGQSRTIGRISSSVSTGAEISGLSALQGKVSTVYVQPVQLEEESTRVQTPIKSVANVTTETSHVAVDLSAHIRNRSTFSAKLETIHRHHPVAADNHDDDMQMILLLMAA